jgi:hypothetical protein
MLEDEPAAPRNDRRAAPDDRRATDDRRAAAVTSAGDGVADAAGPGASGSRSARKKRGLLRRTGIILPASGAAVLLVVIVTVASYLTDSKGSGAASLFQSINSLGNSSQVAALEQERQSIIAMDAATQTLTIAAQPTTADAAAILAARNAAAGGGTGGTGGGTGVVTIAPPANPTAAEALGQQLLVSYGGFSSAQWPCLYSLWARESGWNVYAENGASGAYGIPQSLPGDKMASIASDWQTNPATQIKWGLSYIKTTYGTPCAAWQNEESYGYY